MLDRCECGGVLEKIWYEEAEYKKLHKEVHGEQEGIVELVHT